MSIKEKPLTLALIKTSENINRKLYVLPKSFEKTWETLYKSYVEGTCENDYDLCEVIAWLTKDAADPDAEFSLIIFNLGIEERSADWYAIMSRHYYLCAKRKRQGMDW